MSPPRATSCLSCLTKIDRWYSDLTQESKGCRHQPVRSNIQPAEDHRRQLQVRGQTGAWYHLRRPPTHHEGCSAAPARHLPHAEGILLSRVLRIAKTHRARVHADAQAQQLRRVQAHACLRHTVQVQRSNDHRRLQIVSASTSKCQRTTKHAMALLRS